MKDYIESVINQYDIFLKHNRSIYPLENVSEYGLSKSINESMSDIDNYYYKTESNNLRMLIDKISTNRFIRDKEFAVNCVKYKYN